MNFAVLDIIPLKSCFSLFVFGFWWMFAKKKRVKISLLEMCLGVESVLMLKLMHCAVPLALPKPVGK